MPLPTLFKNFLEIQKLAVPNLDIIMILSLLFKHLKDHLSTYLPDSPWRTIYHVSLQMSRTLFSKSGGPDPDSPLGEPLEKQECTLTKKAEKTFVTVFKMQATKASPFSFRRIWILTKKFRILVPWVPGAKKITR